MFEVDQGMDGIRLTVECGLARVTFARPERRNSMTVAMIALMRDVVREVAARGDVKVVLVDAEGKDFCAGVDLDEFAGVPDPAEHARTGVVWARRTVEALYSISVPVITAVQGAAAGGGLGIALSGDIILAARDARFVMPNSRLGLSPDSGVSWQLVRRLGAARAMDVLLTGRTVSAEVAYDWGLVSRLVAPDELNGEAERIAADLAAGPTSALIATKRLARAAQQQVLSVQLRDEQDSFGRLGGRADQVEGVAAFVERRAPEFGSRAS